MLLDKRKLADGVRSYFYSQFKDYELRASGIYAIRNKVNDDTYIGSTGVTFKLRLSQHIGDLVNSNHSNRYLQEAWENYNYDDFEFVILEKAGETDTRDFLFMKEMHHIDTYIKNNKRLYNLDMNKESGKIKLDYIMRMEKKHRVIADPVKDYLRELLGNTFYDSMMNEIVIEEVLSGKVINEDTISLGIEDITEHKYNGIKQFLGNINSPSKIRETWQHEYLDACHCNIIKCMYYDSDNHHCRMYDSDLSEQWTPPKCKYYDYYSSEEQFYNNMADKINYKPNRRYYR